MKKLSKASFSQRVKIRLVELEKPHNWLIERVREDTGLYFDRSYLSKIMTGKIATPSIVTSICKILNIEREEG